MKRSFRETGLLLVAVGLLATCDTVFADTVVKSFTYGEGDAELGYIAAGEYADANGPSSIAASQGYVYVLDRANQRVVRIPADGSGAIERYPVPPDIDPVDVVVSGDRIFVYDQLKGSRAIVPDDSAGQTEAGGEAAAAVVRSQFAALGFGLAPTDGGQNESGGGAGSPIVGAAQVVLATDGRRFEMRFVPDSTGLPGGEAPERGRIVLRDQTNPSDAVKVPVRRQGTVEAVRVLRFVPGEEVLVEIDEIIANEDGDVVQSVVFALAPDGRPLGEYTEPESDAPLLISRSIVVDHESGRVFALAVMPDRTDVIELTRSAPRLEAMPQRTERTGNDTPPVQVDRGSPEILAAVKSISRDDIIEEAERYVTTSWTVSEKDRGPDGRCDPGQGRYWQRPKMVTGPGSTVRGVPYCWGCTDSPAEFLDAIDTDRKRAGNTCARRDCAKCIAPSTTAGVDCSGFISNVWRLGKQVTTRSIESVAAPVQLTEMNPGDVFNKAGSHVILLGQKVQTNNGKALLIYDSSVSCGGTCKRIVPWKTVEKYKPYTRRSLKVEG